MRSVYQNSILFRHWPEGDDLGDIEWLANQALPGLLLLIGEVIDCFGDIFLLNFLDLLLDFLEFLHVEGALTTTTFATTESGFLVDIGAVFGEVAGVRLDRYFL